MKYHRFFKSAYVVVAIYAAFIFNDNNLSYGEECFDQEAQMLRSIAAQGNATSSVNEKLKALPELEEAESRRCSTHIIPDDDKDRIVLEKKSLDESYRMETRRNLHMKAPTDTGIPNHDLGIREIDAVLPVSIFNQVNAWQGYIDNSLVLVAAGSESNNPQQGIVVVLDGGFKGSRQSFPTPSATGSIRITEEDNGILTIKSITGTVMTYSGSSNGLNSIQTQGGITYYFDIRNKIFVH